MRSVGIGSLWGPKIVSWVPQRFSARLASRSSLRAVGTQQCASSSPDRRTHGPVHSSTSNAAQHHCTLLGEAMPQLHFWAADLQKAVAVQLALRAAVFDHPLRLV